MITYLFLTILTIEIIILAIGIISLFDETTKNVEEEQFKSNFEYLKFITGKKENFLKDFNNIDYKFIKYACGNLPTLYFEESQIENYREQIKSLIRMEIPIDEIIEDELTEKEIILEETFYKEIVLKYIFMGDELGEWNKDCELVVYSELFNQLLMTDGVVNIKKGLIESKTEYKDNDKLTFTIKVNAIVTNKFKNKQL